MTYEDQKYSPGHISIPKTLIIFIQAGMIKLFFP